MARTEDIYPHFEPYDAFQIFPAPQQPTAVLQQLPATTMPPGSAPSSRPGGHVKEDLVELMMIQTVQMHQVIMNTMTASALSSLGSSSRPPAAPRDLVIIQENETDPEIYHHFYLPSPYLSYPAWLPQQATLVCYDPSNPSSVSPHTQDRPPPPPPSTAQHRGDCRRGRHSAQQHPASSTQPAAPSRQPINTVCPCDVTGASQRGDNSSPRENSGAAEAEAEDKRE